jgi:hypothetical protein
MIVSAFVHCLVVCRTGSFGSRQGRNADLTDTATLPQSVCSKWLTNINKVWRRTEHDQGFHSSGDEYNALQRGGPGAGTSVASDKQALRVWFEHADSYTIDRTFHEAVGFWIKRGRIYDTLGCRLRTGQYSTQLSTSDKIKVLPNLLVGRFVPGVFSGTSHDGGHCVATPSWKGPRTDDIPAVV